MVIWALPIGIGIVAVALLAAWFIGRRSGADNKEKGYIERDLEAGRRISDAVANIPTDSDALLDELRSGRRKL